MLENTKKTISYVNHTIHEKIQTIKLTEYVHLVLAQLLLVLLDKIKEIYVFMIITTQFLNYKSRRLIFQHVDIIRTGTFIVESFE